jgi:hypothetical protein
VKDGLTNALVVPLAPPLSTKKEVGSGGGGERERERERERKERKKEKEMNRDSAIEKTRGCLSVHVQYGH